MRLALGAAALLIALTPAFADDIDGEWLRTDGKTKVRFAPCGDEICGTISWVKDPNAPGKVGMKVFSLKPASGGGWAGTASNPEDGREYSGTASIAAGKLNTTGCALLVICKTFYWTRTN